MRADKNHLQSISQQNTGTFYMTKAIISEVLVCFTVINAYILLVCPEEWLFVTKQTILITPNYDTFLIPQKHWRNVADWYL